MAKTNPKTIIEISEKVAPNIFEDWAIQNGLVQFELTQSYDLAFYLSDGALYKSNVPIEKRGGCFLIVRPKEKTIQVEAYFQPSSKARMASLGFLPKTVGIESGGMTAALPRKKFRVQINSLLDQFGQKIQ